MRESLLRTPAPILDFGKLPPQAVDVEKAILSAALIERMAIVEISAIVRSPEYFYKNEHALIYESILDLYAAGENIDVLTVVERLRKRGHLDTVGGPYYVGQLANMVGSTAHVSDWCYVVKEMWVKRSIISSSSEAISEAYDDTMDALELLDSFAVKVNSIQSQMVTSDGKTWAMSVQEFDEEMTAPENEGAIPGFSTGYERLDARSLGYQKRHLTLIAGRPGEGKCLGAGTKIIMFDGTVKKVEDIVAGDKLIGPDSKPKTVLSVTSGEEMMYWVRQNRAMDYRVNESHILSLRKVNGRGIAYGGKVVNICLKDYLKWTSASKQEHKGWRVSLNADKKPLWSGKDIYITTGISIEKDGMGTYYGFELDGDGLFLLEDGTVTHNTTLAIQGLRHNAMNGIPVGMVSMEMTKAEILIKLYAMEAGIDTEKMQTRGLTAEEWKRYHAAKAVISKWPIYIHDESGMTINQIKSILTMWKLKYGVELAFIDYLQLATVGNDVKRVNSREQEIGYISRTCKAIAMNLDVSVVALSAMSRDIEGRQKSERRPTNSDLRDSGSLEQDANKIIFVYRPEEHGIMQYEDGSSTEGVTEFLLTKARLSSKGTTKAKFEKAFSLFIEPGSYMAVEKPNTSPSVQGFKKLEDLPDVPF